MLGFKKYERGDINMWIENKFFHQDLEYILHCNYIPWDRFKGKTILITGATGLLGFNIVSALSYVSLKKNIQLKVLALVRNKVKAKERFASALSDGAPIYFITGDLDHIPPINEHIDFIIHGGSPTASRYFVEYPVKTIMTNLHSAISLLNLAKEKRVEGFLFLSSMEVYGGIHLHEKIRENHHCFINTMVPRSSYPEVKRMVESLCACYAKEFHVPAKTIRLTQTFGIGVRENDNRVFAQFARSAMAHKDIILFTKGGTEHSYLYTGDAVTATITILLLGNAGEAYNAANEQTYCSIKELAEMIANLTIIKEKFAGPVRVIIDESRNKEHIYPPELYMDLDTRKLQSLGWSAKYGLEDMLVRMIETMDE